MIDFVELDGCRTLTICHSVAMLLAEDICRMITIIVLKPPSRLPLGIAGADLFRLLNLEIPIEIIPTHTPP